MELRRRIEKILAEARQKMVDEQPGPLWAYWHGVADTCELILGDMEEAA